MNMVRRLLHNESKVKLRNNNNSYSVENTIDIRASFVNPSSVFDF